MPISSFEGKAYGPYCFLSPNQWPVLSEENWSTLRRKLEYCPKETGVRLGGNYGTIGIVLASECLS